MSTIYNAQTFNVAPSFSGANIGTGTIPGTSVVGTALTLGGTQPFTGIQTFTQMIVGKFSTDPGVNSNLRYGYQAGMSITSGIQNTLWGYQAGKSLTGGSRNSFYGYQAGMSCLTGDDNTVMGSGAFTLGTGSRNSIAGKGAAPSLVTGDDNTWIGMNTGVGSTNVSRTTCFGKDSTCANFSDSTAMGIGATATAAHQMMFGRSSETAVFQGTGTGAIADGAFLINSAKTTVSGSTSGTADFSMPTGGSADKKVMIYCAALVGTASYTFPIAFIAIPIVTTTNGLSGTVVTTLSTTAVTVTGTTSSGFIILEGV